MRLLLVINMKNGTWIFYVIIVIVKKWIRARKTDLQAKSCRIDSDEITTKRVDVSLVSLPTAVVFNVLDMVPGI